MSGKLWELFMAWPLYSQYVLFGGALAIAWIVVSSRRIKISKDGIEFDRLRAKSRRSTDK